MRQVPPISLISLANFLSSNLALPLGLSSCPVLPPSKFCFLTYLSGSYHKQCLEIMRSRDMASDDRGLTLGFLVQKNNIF